MQCFVTILNYIHAYSYIYASFLLGLCNTGYGNIAAEVDVSIAKVFSKMLFTMLTPEVEEEMKRYPKRKSVVLFGIVVICCAI